MDLYLLRHGAAEDAKPDADDYNRALTAEGRSKLRSVLTQVAHAKITPALILSSHLKRAVQTAEIAARTLHYPGEILQSQSLAPDGSPESVWDEIRVHRAEPSLLLVSHNPLLTHLTSYLLGAPSLETEFKKGALLKMTIEGFSARPRGVLRWFLTAKITA